MNDKTKAENIVKLLKRLEKTQQINLKSLARLEEEWEHQQASQTAYVTTAVPMTKEEKKELATNLGFLYGSRFIIRNRVSKKVIGGARIKVGSKIIDNTIQNQLKKIKRLLVKDD